MKQMEINLRVKQQRYVMTIYKRKRKDALKNMIRIFFGGNFIVEIAFKFNANDSS